jgi:hypothetical protein
MRIYLSGPMLGIPEFNFPVFYAMAAKLRQHGHTVFNPAERANQRHGVNISEGNATGDEVQLVAEHGLNLREALHTDLAWICLEADAIAMLPGWENSLGACAEIATARALRLGVIILGEYDE